MDSHHPQLAGSCENTPAVRESLPFCSSDSLKLSTARIHSPAASFPLCLTPVLWAEGWMMYLGENKKEWSLLSLQRNLAGRSRGTDMAVSKLPCKWVVLRGKNFHSFVYKPEGVGNPHIILMGTLKDYMKLHKNIQNFPENFGTCVTVTWQLCAFFHMKQAASWRTVGCCVTCVTFTKVFYKVIGWLTVCKCKLNAFFISASIGCFVEWDMLRITDTVVFLICHWSLSALWSSEDKAKMGWTLWVLESQFRHYSKTNVKNCINLDNLNEPEMVINTLLSVNVFPIQIWDRDLGVLLKKGKEKVADGVISFF